MTLRQRAGLSPKGVEAARRGVEGSVFAVVLEYRGEAIGMGRIIGDGGTAFQVVDIAVLPEHQGRGLGKRIVGALVDWLRREAPPTAFVSLLADGPAKHLYSQFGFEETAPESVGMALRIE